MEVAAAAVAAVSEVDVVREAAAEATAAEKVVMVEAVAATVAGMVDMEAAAAATVEVTATPQGEVMMEAGGTNLSIRVPLLIFCSLI